MFGKKVVEKAKMAVSDEKINLKNILITLYILYNTVPAALILHIPDSFYILFSS